MSKKLRGSLSDFAARKGQSGITSIPETVTPVVAAAEYLPATGTSEPHSEADYLTNLEQIIETNIQAFYQVGCALRDIRDRQLYKLLGYTRFEDYCEERWDISRIHAYRLESAAKVIDNLKMLPNGLQCLPTSERQVRPLAALPPEQQRQMWEHIIQTAPLVLEKPKITTKLVEETVAMLSGETKQPPQTSAGVVRQSLRFSAELDDTLNESLYRIRKMLGHDKKAAVSKDLITEAILRHGLAELEAQGKNSPLWQAIEQRLNQDA